MWLNSLPSAANSSLPSAGTLTLKSPRPRRCAACSSRSTSFGSVRLTITANSIASARKPSVRPITRIGSVSPLVDDRREQPDRRRGCRPARRRGRTSCGSRARRSRRPSPARRRIRRVAAAGDVDASTSPPRSTRACTSSTWRDSSRVGLRRGRRQRDLADAAARSVSCERQRDRRDRRRGVPASNVPSPSTSSRSQLVAELPRQHLQRAAARAPARRPRSPARAPGRCAIGAAAVARRRALLCTGSARRSATPPAGVQPRLVVRARSGGTAPPRRRSSARRRSPRRRAATGRGRRAGAESWAGAASANLAGTPLSTSRAIRL